MGEQIRPGLWRWSAPHPDWQRSERDDAPTSWPREVGCVLHQTHSDAVFIDPLAPRHDPAFWAWADQLCQGREVSVLETIHYHRRSREEFLARYGATTTAPAGVLPLPLPAFGETLHWIAEHRALVPGDTLISGADGELRMCPQSWLDCIDRRLTRAALRAALEQALAGLDIELVLVSHGEPVLRGGAAALAAALREP
jgi:hypothetical protein